MIYGFLRPSEGSVRVEGLDVVRHPREVRRRLGIAPQEDVLDPDLSVTQNLLFHARYSGISAPEARRRSDQLLDSMGLSDHADAALGHLSTGLRRRLVLARALLNNPAIVVLDEPTRGLDRESRRRYVDVLQEMKKRGVTLMLATHELTEAEALCDRVAKAGSWLRAPPGRSFP
jgi:ABC-type multidrug transport system ATPase subunit